VCVCVCVFACVRASQLVRALRERRKRAKERDVIKIFFFVNWSCAKI
jgi:hypothetical protein